MFSHAKIMFEIYREAGYDRRYRVVFFTELDEHNRDVEIARAVAGDHFYDGYLKEESLPQAKRAIAQLLDHLNGGTPLSTEEIDRAMYPYKA